jgi:hypothetical protein
MPANLRLLSEKAAGDLNLYIVDHQICNVQALIAANLEYRMNRLFS